MSVIIDLDPTEFLLSSSVATGAASAAATARDAAVSSLSKLGNMAGSDPAGRDWADAYDPAAAAIVANVDGLFNGLSAFATGLAYSGRNYAAADWLSCGNAGDPPGFDVPPLPQAVCSAPPASAHGGTPFSIPGLEFITDFIGNMWPDGDVEKLRNAGKTWTDLGEDLRNLNARNIGRIAPPLDSFTSPELPIIRTKLTEVSDSVRELASQCDELGSACAEFADHIEQTHKDTEAELAELLIEVGATVGISVALSFFTFGTSAVAGAAVAGGRVALTVSRVTVWLTNLGVKAAQIAARVASIGGRFVKAGEIAAKITVKAVPFAGKSVIFGAANVPITVGATYIVEGPDADLWGAAVNGFVGGTAGGAIGMGLGSAATRLATAAATRSAAKVVTEFADETGTVWDNIVPTTTNLLPHTKIPATFTIRADNGAQFWVNSNATEHFGEYFSKFYQYSHGSEMAQQAILSSFQSAISKAAAQGISMQEKIMVDGWAFVFTQRSSDLFPVLKHALFEG